MPTGTIKISEFLLKAATTGDEYFPIVDAGENKRATLSTALAGYSPTGHTHDNYITGFTESDPVFASASGSFALTNHIHANYITGFTETDPVFAAASGGFSTTGHTHDNYITGFTESDPVFASASGSFALTNHIHANYITGFTETDPVFAAASGGFSTTGHTHDNYITGFTESDPVFTAHVVYDITSGMISAWNAATGASIGILQVTGETMASGDWASGSPFYTYVITNENIYEDRIVEIIPDNSDYATVVSAEILPSVLSASGQATVYAVNEPTADIGITINISQRRTG